MTTYETFCVLRGVGVSAREPLPGAPVELFAGSSEDAWASLAAAALHLLRMADPDRVNDAGKRKRLLRQLADEMVDDDELMERTIRLSARIRNRARTRAATT